MSETPRTDAARAACRSLDDLYGCQPLERLARQLERDLAAARAKLDAVAAELGLPAEAHRIAGCDVLAHYVRDTIINARRERDRLQAKLAECEKDAARYRWLRDGVYGQRDELAPNGQDFVLTPPDVMDCQNIMEGDVTKHLDAAIDAARKEGK